MGAVDAATRPPAAARVFVGRAEELSELHAALRHWIDRAFPFTRAYYSNTEIPELPG